MDGWIEWLAFDDEVPNPVNGHGESTVEQVEDKNFRLDEKTGLLLPEAAYKQRRKIIGFNQSD